MDDDYRIGILFGKLGYRIMNYWKYSQRDYVYFFEIWIIMGYYNWIMG
jgi:hypothetical protein